MNPQDLRTRAGNDAAGLFMQAIRDVTRPFAGAYRSAFHGRGLVFDELRDYVPGDDAQWIEWKATARLGRPILKRMREERERAVALVVDASDSSRPGFAGRSRAGALQRVAAALALVATRAGDPLGFARFGDGAFVPYPPRKGPAQLERVLAALAQPVGGASSDLAPTLQWAVDRLPRRSLVIVLSDGYLAEPGPVVSHCARTHELVALWVEDRIDVRIPSGAPLRYTVAESRSRGVWAARRPLERLPLERLRQRGASVAALHTESLLSDLRRFLWTRAGIRA